jgi:hypothetical protein
MRVVLMILLAALVFVPSAAPKGIPEGQVIYAVWMIGGRFDREEWLERATGATHRRDTGGPADARHTVANARWVVRYETHKGPRRDGPYLHRVRSRTDASLLDSSDLLRPMRMLRLGRAEVIGPLNVDDLAAVRLRVPWTYGTQYADLELRSRLPLRFVFIRNRQEVDVWKLRYRSKRRSSLPSDFFSPRRTIGGAQPLLPQ